MQKISSYLYPNKIHVVADVSVFPVRWNIVYQNRVKIYQGVDNVLTFDIKNADQKRIDVSDMNIQLNVQDILGNHLVTVPVVPTDRTGLAVANIMSDDVADMDPQFLKFSVYRINEDQTITILYADTQFGAVGNMELIGGIMPAPRIVRTIQRFTYETDRSIEDLRGTVTYYSEAADIKMTNVLHSRDSDSIELEFKFKSLQARVSVQFTKDPVIGHENRWVDVDVFDVGINDVSLTKNYQYPVYDREYIWARIMYVPVARGPGTIDKVTIKL